jgi:hypothetical protein
VLHADELGDDTLKNLGGTDIGHHDAVRRRFSDRPIIEHPLIRRAPLAVNWAEDEEIEIDLSTFDPYPFTLVSPINVAALAPAGTTITDILGTYFDGPLGGATGKTQAFFKEIRDLGTNFVTLVLAAPPAGITNEDMWIEVEIAYPHGIGLTFTPYENFGDHYKGDGSGTYSIDENNIGLRPADCDEPNQIEFNHTNRELQDLYITVAQTVNVTSEDTLTVILPERVLTVVSVEETGGGGFKTVDPSFIPNDPERKIPILPATPLSGNAVNVEVIYIAIRTWPPITGYFHTIYYHSRALQAIRDTQLPVSLAYRVVYVLPYVYALTAGTGSFGTPYPFETPGHHIAVNQVTYFFFGEHDLDSPLDIFTDDFDADSGFMRVIQSIPFIPLSSATLTRTAVVDIDNEHRAFYPTVPSIEYKPAAFGKNLSFPQRHKVFFPVIAELLTDYAFAAKNSLVMLVFSRWSNFDAENSIRFSATDNTSCAAVYRLKGNLLLNRRG